MAEAGVPMCTIQEWMGHRDIQTTQRYAHYAPRTRDAELVAAAFSPAVRGLIRGLNLSESEGSSEKLSSANMGESTS
jgi:hypothetical protein